MANKKDLVQSVAEATGLSKKVSGEAVNAVFAEIENILVSGEELQLTGFGKFSTAERAGRKGRNPQTGEEIQIPARTVPKFKASKKLKEAVK